MRSGEVLMLGDINIDTVWPVDQLPGPGHDAYVKSVSVGLGGAVLNTAIVLDRLDQPTGMLSCVGKDLWAAQAFELMRQTRVNMANIRVRPELASGLIFLAVTPDGERTMFSFRGANTRLAPEDLPVQAFEQASILHISGYSLLEAPQKDAVWRAVELARANGVAISLDTGLEPALLVRAELCRLIEMSDICVTGPKEMKELYGVTTPEDAADKLLSLGVRMAAVKQGEGGSLVADQETNVFCPAFPVEVVDTTGAGDSFSAGLLYGWTHELSLAAAAVLASALGALATTVYGAGLGLPGKEAVRDLLKGKQQLLSSALNEGAQEVIKALENQQ
jgi:ribokinase